MSMHRTGVLSFVPMKRWGSSFRSIPGAPSIVLQLIASVQFSEKPAYLYFVCTCGDDTGKTAEIFCKAVGRRGWKCQAGFSVIMPNTYVCLPGFDIDWRDVAETNVRKRKYVWRRLHGSWRSVCSGWIVIRGGSRP